MKKVKNKFLTALAALLACGAATAQDLNISGRVVDAAGEPVVGASVVVKGTSTGVTTGMNGDYDIAAPADATLTFSFLGLGSKEEQVAGRSRIDIAMSGSDQTIEEVVVTALGIKRESKALGYAVSTVGAEELVKTGSPNFATALYGKTAGVRIQAAPGGATSAVSVNVRGVSSLTGSSQPMVIIDGVPVRNGDANNSGENRIQSNGLTDINTEDIASLTILKGASATALYGSEAANGVIVITTKSGQRGGGWSVDVNAYWSADVLAYMPEAQSVFGRGYVAYQAKNYNEEYPFYNGGFYKREISKEMAEGAFAQYQWKEGDRYYVKSVPSAWTQYGPKYDGSMVYFWDGKMRPYVAGGDPYDDIYKTAWNQTYNVAVTHGSENSNIRVGYTGVNNTPMVDNSKFQKHNFSTAGGAVLNKYLGVNYSASYMREYVLNRPAREGGFMTSFYGMFTPFDDLALLRKMAVTSAGYKNVVREYGTASWNNKTVTPDEAFAYDPRQMLDVFWDKVAHKTEEARNRLISSVSPYWNIIEGLQLKGSISTDLSTNKIEDMNNNERPLIFNEGTESTGEYRLRNERYEIYYGNVMLSYDKKFMEKYGLTANVGYQGRMEQESYVQASTDGGLSVENWFDIKASAYKANSETKKRQLLKAAYYGNVGVSYGDFAYLEGTARQEKTSTLAPGNNSFFYPSVSASFIYTDAFKGMIPSWYSYGKLRMSYAVVGNSPETYLANIAYNQSQISGYTYNTTMEAVGNDKLKPETKYEWELGLENKFFNNRLGLEISLYTNKVKDQIIPVKMPITSGGASILQNMGELQNRGLEILLRGTPYRDKDWQVELNTNVAFQRNKVTALPEGFEYTEHGSCAGAVEVRSYVGQPMGDIYAYVPYRDPETGKKVVGTDGLYIIDMSAMKKVGNAMPKVIGGFGGDFSWKGLSLSVVFDYRIGGAVMSEPYQYQMGAGNLVESLPYRDAEHGGLTYYFENNNAQDGKLIAWNKPTGPNGEIVFDNGIILDAMKGHMDGEDLVIDGKNDIIAPADKYYYWTFNWGTGDPTNYEESIFDNSYVKCREIALSYQLPQNISNKFACKNLVLSAFARNPFYVWKNMPAYDAEATTATSWSGQALLGSTTATARTFGFSLRMTF